MAIAQLRFSSLCLYRPLFTDTPAKARRHTWQSGSVATQALRICCRIHPCTRYAERDCIWAYSDARAILYQVSLGNTERRERMHGGEKYGKSKR